MINRKNNIADFIEYYRANENAFLRVLINSQRTLFEKDAKIRELEKKLFELENNSTLDVRGQKEPFKLSRKKYVPKITIGIASYNHSRFLEQCVNSALEQSYSNYEIIIVDDHSTDKKNYEILKKYKNHPKVRVIYKEKNEGISASLNDQIINSTGEWVAFLDCDDYLPNNALSEMVKYARRHQDKKLLFSNRYEVNQGNEFIRTVDFGSRGKNPDIFDELLKGMASSHLKMLHKDLFRIIGVFDSKYDGIQDYDIYLRTAMYMPHVIAHLDKELYFHRIHDHQNTIKEEKKHEKNLQLLKEEIINRKQILVKGIQDKVSIIILSYNRGDQTQKCITRILHAASNLKIEIIIWDNGSDDEMTLKILRNLSKNKLISVHYSRVNLRCSGGRKAAARLATGKYLLFLDNDIEINDRTIKELLISVTEDKEIAASCCRLAFPDTTLQFNGASYKKDKQFIEFELIDNGRNLDDFASLIKRRDCKWLPGGATLVKKEVFDQYEFDEGFINAYEDNDLYMRIKNDGHLLVNSPLATATHNHIEFIDDFENGAVNYVRVRKNYEDVIKSWFHFYKKWGLVISDPGVFFLLGIDFMTESTRLGNEYEVKVIEQKLQSEREDLSKQLQDIVNSSSWRITKPLRVANYFISSVISRLKGIG